MIDLIINACYNQNAVKQYIEQNNYKPNYVIEENITKDWVGLYAKENGDTIVIRWQTFDACIVSIGKAFIRNTDGYNP